MTDKRIIKKYPNRRLYDTAESKYITLDDVRKLVIEGVPFCVTDKQTGEDITRSILLQIIIEREEAGTPLFSTDVLEHLIGFYGKSMQGSVSSFFQQGLAMLTEQQHAFQEQVSKAVGGTPLAAFKDMTERNLELWNKMQQDFLNAMGQPLKEPGTQEPSDKKS